MDDRRFDNLTKALATGISRRVVLKGLVAGAIASVTGFVGVRHAGAQSNGDGSGELGDLGDACSDVLPCRQEYVCAEGVCSEPDGSGELGDMGDDCSEVLPCRAEYVCAEGVCAAPGDSPEPDGPAKPDETAEPDGSGELGDLGDACSNELPCRGEYVCKGGYCSDNEKADVLPRTGTGPAAGGGNDGWLAPAALATAAFALSRLRRPTDAERSAD